MTQFRGLAGAAISVAWFTFSAAAQDTIRVSVSSSSQQSDGDSKFRLPPEIS